MRKSVFAVSALLHLAILIPFVEMKDSEKAATEPCVTFSINTAAAWQQESAYHPEKQVPRKAKRPEPAAVKKKTTKSPEKTILPPVPPAPSFPGDSPPLTRQEPAAASAPALPPQETPAPPQSGKYLSMVRTRIEAKKHYPPFARSLQHEGTVVVNVTIGTAGAIISAGIARSSGYESLDKAAVEAVRKAGPFPPPTVYGLGQISIDVPLVFRLI